MGACSACGSDVGAGVRFCGQCGAACKPVERLPGGDRAPAQTGTLLTRAAAPAPAPEPVRAAEPEPLRPAIRLAAPVGLSARRTRVLRRVGTAPVEQARDDAPFGALLDEEPRPAPPKRRWLIFARSDAR